MLVGNCFYQNLYKNESHFKLFKKLSCFDWKKREKKKKKNFVGQLRKSKVNRGLRKHKANGGYLKLPIVYSCVYLYKVLPNQ